MSATQKKIGLMGGTFDPIHNAHLALAECAMSQLRLSEVWFIPAGNPYLHKHSEISSAEDRCRMTELALSGYKDFRLSLIEQDRPGRTYTADTLEELKACYPEAEFYFIIGTDQLYSLEQWHRADKVLSSAVLAVAEREYPDQARSFHQEIRYLREKYQARIVPLAFREIDISSTVIRERIQRGKDAAQYLPPAVYRYILERGLYRSSRPAGAGKDMQGTASEKAGLEEIMRIRAQLQKELRPERYEHSLSVSFSCIALAMRYSCDLKKAELAGLVHDCAKHFSGEALLSACTEDGVELTPEMMRAPQVIHSVYGAVYARKRYGIEDEEILSAVRHHTLGRPGMTLLEKIVFTADYIEARRCLAPRLPELRSLAFQDLDRTVYEILRDSLDYLDEKGIYICEASRRCYEYYKKEMEERNDN